METGEGQLSSAQAGPGLTQCLDWPLRKSFHSSELRYLLLSYETLSEKCLSSNSKRCSLRDYHCRQLPDPQQRCQGRHSVDQLSLSLASKWRTSAPASSAGRPGRWSGSSAFTVTSMNLERNQVLLCVRGQGKEKPCPPMAELWREPREGLKPPPPRVLLPSHCLANS